MNRMDVRDALREDTHMPVIRDLYQSLDRRHRYNLRFIAELVKLHIVAYLDVRRMRRRLRQWQTEQSTGKCIPPDGLGFGD